MSDVDFYITYFAMPLSIILVITMYIFRRKGRFNSVLGKVMYFLSSLLVAGVLGVVMHVNEGNLYVFSLSAITILFLVFIYNAPIRKQRSDWR